jgi:polyphosphate kinase 2 (PPK2 family)
MSKSQVKLVQGEHYNVLQNGCIRVCQHYGPIELPYDREPIPHYLSLVDHALTVDKNDYDKLIDKEEKQLNLLARMLKQHNRALVIVFQGRDGAGKSGATERIIEAVDYDIELFDAVHIGPPTDEELSHPFLWRFGIHDRMPKIGQVRVFDRSWNERLLVEPVLGITKGTDLKKSYGQIRAYEWLHTTQGYVLLKFWLDITKKEQERRFKKREAKKPWKVSPSDATARKAWDQYTSYANEMFHRTATPFAPWYLVSSEDKKYSRLCILQVINETLREHLEM